ncbi:MAG: Mrp/NBP35 family ATP-binding protein [Oscillospiraceae bacterium]
MSESCTHDCSSCSESCSEREDLIEKPHKLSRIKKVIGVVSGKGGVGKSLVTSMLAVLMNRQGFKTAILDADVTGPSIPKIFGLTKKAEGCDDGIFPVNSKMGTEIMSVNLLLDDDTAPVIWRGPVIAGAVKQFWTDVIWNDVDFMFVDMPPGTGDVPLTVFQSIPLDGIIIVTSPQQLVSMIVTKAVKMAKEMNIPILGVIENMSYVTCPDCSKKFKIYGESHIEEVTKQNGIDFLGEIPINPEFASLCDKGCIELFEGEWLDKTADIISKLI